MCVTSLFKNFHYVSLAYHTVISMLLFAQYFFRWDFFFQLYSHFILKYLKSFLLRSFCCKKIGEILIFWEKYFLPYRYFTCLCHVMISMFPFCSYAKVFLNFYIIYFHIILFSLLMPTVLDWIMTHSYLPKNVHILFPKTCEYVTLHGTKDVQNVIQLRISIWKDHPGWSGWILCHHKGP